MQFSLSDIYIMLSFLVFYLILSLGANTIDARDIPQSFADILADVFEYGLERATTGNLSLLYNLRNI